ncbi:MAG: hypothetical protein KC415_12235 [Anaerolineales bacterium]|nr:hypothetical protein [Anaerolineales bacterium]
MLDDIELPQVQEITTYDRRMLAEHKPPGMDGSLLQNLGRRPIHLTLWGVKTGSDALEFVEKLEQKYRDGRPIPFTPDIIADADIEKMVIDDLQWQEVAGKPNRYSYILTLREYIEPVEPEDTSALDNDVLGDAGDLFDDLVGGLDIGLDFATGLERFVAPLSDMLGRLRQFNQTQGGGN